MADLDHAATSDETTAEPQVDAALSLLEDLESLSPDQQVERLTRAHELLHQALDAAEPNADAQ